MYLYTILDNMFLTAVKHEVNNLESSVVVQELELAINIALYGFYGVKVTSTTQELCLDFLQL